jgi:hypothetical protein
MTGHPDELAEMIGGPNDGGLTLVPSGITPIGQLPAVAFGNDIYVYAPLNGKLAWHYAGTATWTHDEKVRRGIIEPSAQS